MINHDSGQYFATDLKHQIGSILDNEDALRSDFCISSENETDDVICNDNDKSEYLQLFVKQRF